MKIKIIIILIILAPIFLIALAVYLPRHIVAGENKNYSIANDADIGARNQPDTIKGPAIKIIPETYDLGTVIYGEVAKHIFTIENIGDEPLEILKLSTSCGCTKALMADEDKIIVPGQSVELAVTFDPAVHKDDTDLGDISRIIYIVTNDPNQPRLEAEITARVIKSNQ